MNLASISEVIEFKQGFLYLFNQLVVRGFLARRRYKRLRQEAMMNSKKASTFLKYSSQRGNNFFQKQGELQQHDQRRKEGKLYSINFGFLLSDILNLCHDEKSVLFLEREEKTAILTAICSLSEILKKRTLNYIAVEFPSSLLNDEDDDEDFPPPPPDALGLPPKTRSHGSLEEVEVNRLLGELCSVI